MVALNALCLLLAGLWLLYNPTAHCEPKFSTFNDDSRCIWALIWLWSLVALALCLLLAQDRIYRKNLPNRVNFSSSRKRLLFFSQKMPKFYCYFLYKYWQGKHWMGHQKFLNFVLSIKNITKIWNFGSHKLEIFE